MEPFHVERDPADVERVLGAYAAALRASPHNLMSPRALAELETRHLPECIAFATSLPRGPAALADIGSGGGLPGLVIALLRADLDVHLIEATGKKAAFLTTTAVDLGIAATVHHGRAEDLGRARLAGRFDLVTARAVAPLVRLVPWAMPLLRPGGTLHAIKGATWEAEVDQARAVLDRIGARLVHTPGSLDGESAPRVVTIAHGRGGERRRTR